MRKFACDVVAAVALASSSASGAVKYAAPGGSGTGADWTDAGDAVTLISAAAAGDEIRFKEGLYDLTAGGASSAVALTLSGGWTGTDDVRGGETLFANAPGNGLSLTATSGTVTLDSLVFSNCVQRGVNKSGAANLFVTNCAFRANGTDTTTKGISGRGASFGGGSGAWLTVVNSLVADNVIKRPSSGDPWGGSQHGQGLYVTSFASARIENCTFTGNGHPAGENTGGNWRDGSYGAALYVACPIGMTNCVFRANRGMAHGADGGIVAVAGSSNAFLDHCLFAGNSHSRWNSKASSAGGPVGTVTMLGTGTLDLNHCTVAYNVGDSRCGGVLVASGTVNVRNSIVYGNASVSGITGSAGDFVVNGGALYVTHSVITGTGDTYAYKAAGKTLVIDGATVQTADPLFATSQSDFLACLTPAAAAFAPQMTAGTKFAADSAYRVFDLHLHSTEGRWNGTGWTTDANLSPAIDAAAADAPYANEPSFNGNRANAGAYGNTSEASKSSSATAVFTSASFALGDDYTRPFFSFALADGAPYQATGYLCCGRTEPPGGDETGWEQVLREDGLEPGDVRSNVPVPTYYGNGEKLYWRIVVKTAGGTTVTNGTLTIAGAEPPQWGRGGGEDIIHVWEGGAAGANGTNWVNAVNTLAAAAALVTETRTNVWVAGTVTPGASAGVEFSRAVTIRGGFTAMENAADERTAGNRATVTDAEPTQLLELAAGSGRYVLDSLILTNASRRALNKSGGSSLTVTNCTFAGNGYYYDAAIEGRGAYLSGTSAARLDVEDCLFLNNRGLGSANNAGQPNGGCAMRILGFGTARVVDTRFYGNGHYGNTLRDGSPGGAVYSTDTSLAMTNCVFRGNRGYGKGGADGGIVYMGKGLGTSSLDHCLLAGNSHLRWDKEHSSYGTVAVNGTSGRVDLNHCTIAYNLGDGCRCAGLGVVGGTVLLRNSIVFGNVSDSSGTGAADVDVHGGTLTISNSVVTSDSDANIYRYGGTLACENVRYGDPLFATTTNDFLAAINSSAPAMPKMPPGIMFRSDANETNFDLHVRSEAGRWTGSDWTLDAGTLSMAIDAGDADAPYDQEPLPSGGVANAGVYGNTPEASKTSVAIVEFAAAGASMTDDCTRPKFFCELASGPAYSAVLTLCFGTSKPAGEGVEGWDYRMTVSTAAGPGMRFDDILSPAYFAAGETLYWRFVVQKGSDLPVTTNGTLVITGTTPPQWGKGGGADVIHVWAGGQGTFGGTNWLDACANLTAAAALVTATRTNIWVAGTVPCNDAVNIESAVSRPVTIRGGFTAMENAPEERPATGRATVNGGQSMKRPTFTAASGTILLERMAFAQGPGNAFYKAGGASLVAIDCAFEETAPILGDARLASTGSGLYASGGATATLFLSNCLFRANGPPFSSEWWGNASGCGAYVTTFASATLVDCLFLTNGIRRVEASVDGTGRDATHGWALCLDGAPATVTGCRFVGSTGTACGYDGSLVYANRASVFRNCLWTGGLVRGYQTSWQATLGGSLVLDLSASSVTALVENCTFAFNALGQSVCAGLNVRTGDVLVRNTVFHANMGTEGSLVAADLYLSGTGARVTVDHSFFAETNATYVGGVDGSALAWGEGVLTGDPRLVTTDGTFLADVASGGTTALPTSPTYVYFRNTANVASYNLHLRGKGGYTDETTGELVRWKNEPNSPAIDTGHPETPYVREPKPNGRRANMGVYGNTPYATSAARTGFCVMIR